MKYVLAILLVAGTMQGQTRAQLKADNADLLAQARYLADYATELSVQIGELQKQVDDLKSTQQILINFIGTELNKPAPQPVIVRQNVPVFVPEPYAVPEPQTIRVIQEAPYVPPVWEDTVHCSGYDIPTPGLTLTYSNCR